MDPPGPALIAESVVALRQAILNQKQACCHAPPTAQQWAEGYEAALGWVLFRLDGLLLNDGLEVSDADS